MQFVIYALPTIIYVHFWEKCFNRVNTLKSTTIHKHIDQSKRAINVDPMMTIGAIRKRGGEGFSKPSDYEHSGAEARPEKATLNHSVYCTCFPNEIYKNSRTL